MARSEYKCAECDAMIKVTGRNRAAADSLAKWHEECGHICADCTKRHLDEENAKAAEANRADELPALTGSEAQIAWAETIRRAVIDAAQTEADKQFSPDTEVFIVVLRRQAAAHWWIDVRGCTSGEIARLLEAQIRAELAPAPPPSTVKVAAEAAALLKPAVEPKSSQIAEVSYMAPALCVAFPEVRDDFRKLMHTLNFKWEREPRRWEHHLDFRSGEPVDRVAEVAHRLIGAGFMVRIHDEDARTKAVAGDFEPEQTRWVAMTKGGAYDQWLRITWSKEDRCYEAARRINGARYANGGVCCPVESIEEVMDFAERYGFAVSEGPRKILERRRAELAQGIVISEPKKPKPVKIETGRPKLAAVEVGIDAEFLDND
jgi:hypothetical protein